MGNARARAAPRRLTSRESRAHRKQQFRSSSSPVGVADVLAALQPASPDARYQHADEKPHRTQAHLSSLGSPSLPTVEQFAQAERSHPRLRLSSSTMTQYFFRQAE
jgi:hypothetical protein